MAWRYWTISYMQLWRHRYRLYKRCVSRCTYIHTYIHTESMIFASVPKLLNLGPSHMFRDILRFRSQLFSEIWRDISFTALSTCSLFRFRSLIRPRSTSPFPRWGVLWGTPDLCPFCILCTFPCHNVKLISSCYHFMEHWRWTLRA